MGKGQVAVFILLGLVILIAIAGVFVIRNIVTDKQLELARYENLEEDVRPIDSIYFIGSQGGFTYLPDRYLATEYSNIAYAFYDDKHTLISRSSMTEQINSFIKQVLPYCLDNFSSFPGQVDYSYSDIKTTTIISDESVSVDLTFPIKVMDTNINEFSAIVPIKLGYIHNSLLDIVAQLETDPDFLDLTYLASLDVKASVVPYDGNNLIYSFEQDDFTFLASVYLIPNTAPEIFIEDTYTIPEHELFTLQIEYTDETNVTFTDDNALFDITKDGLIEFIPEIPGTYLVTIRAEDEQGESTEKQITFIVGDT